MESLKWTKYYSDLDPVMQPNEYLLKLLIGSYKGKKDFLEGKSWKNAFTNHKCLDVGCGDGRNITLLKKLKFEVFATEISDDICKKAYRNLCSANISIPKKTFEPVLIIYYHFLIVFLILLSLGT